MFFSSSAHIYKWLIAKFKNALCVDYYGVCVCYVDMWELICQNETTKSTDVKWAQLDINEIN